jgi:hypothetical protein
MIGSVIPGYDAAATDAWLGVFRQFADAEVLFTWRLLEHATLRSKL